MEYSSIRILWLTVIRSLFDNVNIFFCIILFIKQIPDIAPRGIHYCCYIERVYVLTVVFVDLWSDRKYKTNDIYVYCGFGVLFMWYELIQMSGLIYKNKIVVTYKTS